MNLVCIAASEIPSIKANSIQVMKACQALAQLGHSVRLLTPCISPLHQEPRQPALSASPSVPGGKLAPGDLASLYGLQTQFPIEWLPARSSLKRYDFCWQAVQRARALKADAVYAWPLQAAVFAAVWRIPVLLELHGPPEGRAGRRLFHLFLRLPVQKRLLPITQALADRLAGQYPLAPCLARPACSLVVAPNGVELERYQDLPSPIESRRQLGLAQQVTVGYTGHLYPGRGMALLVELARRLPQINFLWVGGRQNDVDAWKAWIKTEKVTNIRLTGFVDNVQLPRYQAACDVLLMPYERVIAGSSGGDSASYASPMKMFEYMACGRAIIASDLPVIREVLSPASSESGPWTGDANALLCPPEDPQAWTQALTGLLADPPRRAALADCARQDVTRYTWLERARRALEHWG